MFVLRVTAAILVAAVAGLVLDVVSAKTAVTVALVAAAVTPGLCILSAAGRTAGRYVARRAA